MRGCARSVAATEVVLEGIDFRHPRAAPPQARRASVAIARSAADTRAVPARAAAAVAGWARRSPGSALEGCGEARQVGGRPAAGRPPAAAAPGAAAGPRLRAARSGFGMRCPGFAGGGTDRENVRVLHTKLMSFL